MPLCDLEGLNCNIVTESLKAQNVIPSEQKGWSSRGSKDQLLIDHAILKEVKTGHKKRKAKKTCRRVEQHKN